MDAYLEKPRPQPAEFIDAEIQMVVEGRGKPNVLNALIDVYRQHFGAKKPAKEKRRDPRRN